MKRSPVKQKEFETIKRYPQPILDITEEGGSEITFGLNQMFFSSLNFSYSYQIITKTWTKRQSFSEIRFYL